MTPISFAEHQMQHDKNRFLILCGLLFFLAAVMPLAAQPTAPAILIQPQDLSIAANNPATFSVTATNAQRYQWRRNGQIIPGATNSTFAVLNAQQTDSGGYTVVVANNKGAVVSRTAQLKVGGQGQATTTDFQDASPFAGGPLGFVTGNNADATAEPGEPRVGPVPGGKSVWFEWSGFAQSVVQFSTRGSGFDTLLGVYKGPDVSNLTVVAQDDDGGGFLTSVVTFNTDSSSHYFLQVDGFAGSAGSVGVNWTQVVTDERVPEITNQPVSQAVKFGGTAIFSVGVNQPDGAAFTYEWLHNGVLLTRTTNDTLVIPNVQPADVGRYVARVINPANIEPLARSVFSTPALLQISAGELLGTGLGVREKFAESARGLLLRQGGIRPAGGSFARGYVGTQVFSTYGAAGEPNEPPPCDDTGGASQWFTYQAADNGVLRVSTDGSDFDTVLAVYIGPGTDFQSLTNVACDNNSGADGRTSLVTLNVASNELYYIQVDGVNAATGTAVLTYELTTAPAITNQPQSQAALAGTSVAFMVGATGHPLNYQWWFNNAPLAGANNATLMLPNLSATNVGGYSVTVSNGAGMVTSAVANLAVYLPAAITIPPQSQTVRVSSNASFTVTATGTEPLAYQWRFNGTNLGGALGATLTLLQVQTNQAGGYFAVVTNNYGAATSAVATLTVLEALRLASGGKLTNGLFQLQFSNVATQSLLTIEGTSNFTNWQTLLTTNAAAAISVPATNPHRFYRALQGQ